jgi:hypothetical protein
VTIQDGINFLGQYPGVVAGTLAAPPAVAWVLGFFQPAGKRLASSPLQWLYSTVIYSACVPGMLAATLMAYSMFFIRSNVLQMNLLVTLVPLATMVLTIFLVGRKVDFTPLPGFERLWSLIVVLALTFFLMIVLDRFRLMVIFGGSLGMLAVIGVVFFVIMRTALKKLFRE